MKDWLQIVIGKSEFKWRQVYVMTSSGKEKIVTSSKRRPLTFKLPLRSTTVTIMDQHRGSKPEPHRGRTFAIVTGSGRTARFDDIDITAAREHVIPRAIATRSISISIGTKEQPKKALRSSGRPQR